MTGVTKAVVLGSQPGIGTTFCLGLSAYIAHSLVSAGHNVQDFRSNCNATIS